jgi:hypothetical protein
MSRPPGVVVSIASVRDRRPAPFFFQLVYGLDQMRERTREAIELPGDENIALSHEGDGLRQTGAVCLGARCAILENTVKPGGAQGVELERHLLLERRNSCITDLDHCDFSGLVRFSVRQSSCPVCHCQEMFPDSGAIDRQRIDCRSALEGAMARRGLLNDASAHSFSRRPAATPP